MYCIAQRKVLYTYLECYYERTDLFRRHEKTRKKILADTIEVKFCKSEDAEKLIDLKAKEFVADNPAFIGYKFELPNGMEFDIKIYPWSECMLGQAMNELSLGQYLDVCKEYLGLES